METKELKVVIWNPQSYAFGLGDCLRGLAGGGVFANLLDAHLIVGMPPGRECPLPLAELFEASPYFHTVAERIDAASIRSENQFSEFDAALWNRIVRFVKKENIKSVYLASDDKKYFQTWKDRLSRFPLHVINHDQDWSSAFRQTSLQGVVVDLYMMAECEIVFGSITSSLFLIGEALGGRYEIVTPETSIH